jgi:hypothetical protein
MSYLSFEDRGTSESGKTRRWVVKSSQQGDVILGWIEWRATWRRYTFSPTNQTTFDAGCLRDIAEHLEREMGKR